MVKKDEKHFFLNANGVVTNRQFPVLPFSFQIQLVHTSWSFPHSTPCWHHTSLSKQYKSSITVTEKRKWAVFLFHFSWHYHIFRVFSYDVTTAMLVSLNNRTAAMLVSPTNPPGIEVYYHANVFFCFRGKKRLLITWVKTLYIAKYLSVLETMWRCGGGSVAQWLGRLPWDPDIPGSRPALTTRWICSW